MDEKSSAPPLMEEKPSTSEMDEKPSAPVMEEPKPSTVILKPLPAYILVHNPPVGRLPTRIICPHCYQTTTTIIRHTASAKTHVGFLLTVLIGCCCFAPWCYCNHSFMAKNHHCSECNKFVGTYDH